MPKTTRKKSSPAADARNESLWVAETIKRLRELKLDNATAVTAAVEVKKERAKARPKTGPKPLPKSRPKPRRSVRDK
jgi:hypothetical protein